MFQAFYQAVLKWASAFTVLTQDNTWLVPFGVERFCVFLPGTSCVLYWVNISAAFRAFEQSSSVDRLQSKRVGLELTRNDVATRSFGLQLGHHGSWQHIPVLCESHLANYRLSKTMLLTSSSLSRSFFLNPVSMSFYLCIIFKLPVQLGYVMLC